VQTRNHETDKSFVKRGDMMMLLR